MRARELVEQPEPSGESQMFRCCLPRSEAFMKLSCLNSLHLFDFHDAMNLSERTTNRA
jgi:hypothetical protein